MSHAGLAAYPSLSLEALLISFALCHSIHLAFSLSPLCIYTDRGAISHAGLAAYPSLSLEALTAQGWAGATS